MISRDQLREWRLLHAEDRPSEDVVIKSRDFVELIDRVMDAEAQTEWVRDVLAKRGYDGPLTPTSCPLDDWLNPPNDSIERDRDY